MKFIAFDSELYLKEQSKHIAERMENFGDKLYLELGGKLFNDFHASRVLPGFKPNIKLKMLMNLSQKAEIIIAISAEDIKNGRTNNDSGATYEDEVFRQISAFREIGLEVNNVAITKYDNSVNIEKFINRSKSLDVKISLQYIIEDYPNDVNKIISDEGFGKNDFIRTTKPLVIVAAPGSGSGKMAVCLSQLFHENKRGTKAGYAKFETFPVWNLPLEHPVNLAYEAATADLNDVNMIDPFHLEAYQKVAINYNRDIKAFPILSAILSRIMSENVYKSPTDMGVNRVGFCIISDENAKQSSKDEIIRRYFQTKVDIKFGRADRKAVDKIKTLMAQLDILPKDRRSAVEALSVAKQTNSPTIAIELSTGKIITGRTKTLLSASAAVLLNTLKFLANIDDEAHLVSPNIIKPVQNLKTRILGDDNPHLNVDETLIALSISATANKNAKLALDQLENLAQSEAHSSLILPQADSIIFKKLGINLTCEDKAL